MHRPSDHPRSSGLRPEPSARRAGTPSGLRTPGAVPPPAVAQRHARRACRTR
ncbi:hypothetical protein [Streptomyces althioticus]|uniref:hypothetical protein n=1 Tax=Streptomyces althioticus TaxID=83380 RepID=UPI00340FC8F3